MPAMHLVNTVLPAPLSPHSAVTCPDGRSRLTWYRAWTGPKCLSRSWTWSSGSVVATGSALAADISPALSTTGERRLRPPQGGGRVGRGLTPPKGGGRLRRGLTLPKGGGRPRRGLTPPHWA